METLHILDGHGYIFRAFYGLGGSDGRSNRLSTRQGMPTGALYVFARMLVRLHKDVRPDRIAVVFDAKGKTFRERLDENYKANRREVPEDLQRQMPMFRPLTEAFCWPVLSVAEVEADDVIATLVSKARERKWKVVVHSGDKDLLQLVDNDVAVIDSLRQITYDADLVHKKFGVPPAKLGDWLALVGDTSDNVPGVAGVGKVRATQLLNQFGGIDEILANAGELKGKVKDQFTDDVALERLALSRELVRLRSDVPIGQELENLRPLPWDGSALRQLCEELEFQVILESLGEKSASVAKEPAAMPEASIGTTKELLAAFAKAVRQAGRMAVWVQSDGRRLEEAGVIGIGLATDDSAPLYVPISHRYLGAPTQLAPLDWPEAFRRLFDDVPLICWDSKGLLRLAKRIGLGPGIIGMDALLAAYLLDPSLPSYDLKAIGAAWGWSHFPAVDALIGKSAQEFESLGIPKAAQHFSAISWGLLQLADGLEQRLKAGGILPLFRDLELPLARLLGDIEETGVCLDVPVLRALSGEVGDELFRLANQARSLVGDDFHLGSPKQVGTLLFETLGLRSSRMKKKKTGFSTDHEVLEGMRDTHPIVPLILEHRELTKLKGTYIDALPPLVSSRTGRLHTTFQQAVAATGRLSSKDPNLQNIPVRTDLGRRIRRAFVAGDGNLLVSADYSQIELRILAHMSNDPVLEQAFNEDLDVHSQTAAEVFGIPRSEVGPTERRVAKAVNYGLVYGQSDFGLSRALDIPRDKAKHYIERYFERFAKVRSFLDEVVRAARKSGAVVTVLGRRRPIPDITSRSVQRRRAAERMAQNTPVQGSAADIMKLAMLRVHDAVRDSGIPARFLLTVHDEFVFEVPADRADDMGKLLREQMETAYRIAVPLRVDIGCGSNWADAH